jgi:hypothetical protein
MSYTKDFLESKSQQYPEIMKMTDEEALRYLDFMGELVESVNDEMTDIDEGYNVGGRVGFDMGGMSYKDVEERYAEGLTDEEYIRFIKLTPEQRKEDMKRAGVLIDDLAKGGRVGFMGGGMDAGASSSSGDAGAGAGVGFGKGPSNDGKDPGNTGISADDSAEDVYGISPNLGIAEEAQKDRFSPDKDKGLGIVNAFKALSPTLNALRALGYLKDRVEGFFGFNDGEDPGNLGLSYSPNPNNTNLGMTPIGTDVSPSSDPDRGGRADERRVENVLDTELPMEMMFGGDPLKIATYQRYIDAGYPEDQARAIADSLMTNFTA